MSEIRAITEITACRGDVENSDSRVEILDKKNVLYYRNKSTNAAWRTLEHLEEGTEVAW